MRWWLASLVLGCVCACVRARGLYIFDFEQLRVFVLTSETEATVLYIVPPSFLMFSVIKGLLVVPRCGWWISGQVMRLVSHCLDPLRLLRPFATTCGFVCAQ